MLNLNFVIPESSFKLVTLNFDNVVEGRAAMTVRLVEGPAGITALHAVTVTNKSRL